MMFGTKDKFNYFCCANCGCVQIIEIPQNISDYYSNNYYSLQDVKAKISNPIKLFFKKSILRPILLGNSFLLIFIPQEYKSSLGFNWQWFRKTKVGSSSEILDVGCGSGHTLNHLAGYGFENLTGIDPYIKKDIHYANGVKVYKKQLGDLEGKYDFIMLHHSFEHMSDPLAALNDINRLLTVEGKVLVRIPIASSYAWKKYKENWVQLDAPRHFFIHTPKSIGILCRKSGLKIIDVTYDSHELQFYGSEQYLKGIPLFSKKSYMVNPKESIFSPRKIEQFKKKAEILNRIGKGDQAAFWIEKI